MKAKNKYNNRLIKFAEHIQKIKNHPEFGLYESASLVELEEKRNTSFKVTFHGWIFEELPAIFPHWEFSEKNGQPIYIGCHPDEGTVAGVIDFFHLDMNEFCHLFDLEGFQNTKRYGGNHLTFESEGTDIAENIFQLLKYRNEV